MSEPENLLHSGAEVYYYPFVLHNEEAEDYMQTLSREINWKQEPIKIFGRQIMQPRLTALYGDPDRPYTYSGITMTPSKWTATLLELKAIADRLSGNVSSSVLLNLYRDGNDHMGWHRDNERMLGQAPIIASVSLGAKRKFQLRNYLHKKEIRTIILEPGSVLVMKGNTQQLWEHRLPKANKENMPRINLTFREVLHQQP